MRVWRTGRGSCTEAVREGVEEGERGRGRGREGEGGREREGGRGREGEGGRVLQLSSNKINNKNKKSAAVDRAQAMVD